MMWNVLRRLKSWSETILTAREAVVSWVAFDETKGGSCELEGAMVYIDQRLCMRVRKSIHDV